MASPTMTLCDPDTRHVPASMLADALSSAGCWSTREGTVAAWHVCRSWRDVLRSPSHLAAALVAAHGAGNAVDRIVYSSSLSSVEQLALVHEVLACSEPTLHDLEVAFVAATARGATPIVQVLLQHPCTPCLSAKWQNGYALMSASRDGHDDTLKLLLEWPHGERAQQSSVIEAFVNAAVANRLSTMVLLRQHAEPSTNNLLSVFRHAVHADHVDIVRYLLSNPINPVRADNQNIDGLSVAASRGNLGLARLLLSQPQHPARADDNGCHALVAAASAGHWKMVRLLLGWPQHAPPVDCEGSYKALLQAVDRGHVKVVKALLEHFTSALAADRWSEQMLATACEALRMAMYRGPVKVFKALLKHCNSSSPADCCLGPVLIQACNFGRTHYVQLLLARAPNAPSADGEPSVGHGGPLVAAATSGHVHVVRLLLGAGARSRIGEAFRAAAAEGHAEVAKLLLLKAQETDEGAAVAQDVDALAVAIRRGHAEVVSWLLSLRKGCPEASFASVFNDQWLVMAAESACTATVRLLLEALPQAAGVMSRVGKAALLAAVAHGNTGTVQLLLQRMACPTGGAAGGGGVDGNDDNSNCGGGSCNNSNSSGGEGNVSCGDGSCCRTGCSNNSNNSSSGGGMMWWDGQVLETAARRCDTGLVQALLDAWPRPPVKGPGGKAEDRVCGPSGEGKSYASSSPPFSPRSSVPLPTNAPPSPSHSAECVDEHRRRRVQAALAAAAGAQREDVVRQLLQWDHPDAPRADGCDSEALCAAVRNCHSHCHCTSMARLLLNWPVHPALAGCQEGRALADAIANYDAKTLAMLLQHPERPACGDLRDGELLVLACRWGSNEAVRLLLESSHPPRADCLEGRALIEAVERKHVDKVQLLLGWHCHAPRADMNEGEVLIAAAKAGDTSLMETLLSWPSNPPRADCRDGEALMAAVQAGSLEGVRVLLGWPVHPARADVRDGAALLAAVRSRRGAEMLQLLLSWPTHAPRAQCGAAFDYAMNRGDEASGCVLLQAMLGATEEVMRDLVGQCGGCSNLWELVKQALQALTLR